MKTPSTFHRVSGGVLRPRPLRASIAGLLIAAGAASAQTSTLPAGGTFTNPLLWDFGAGPVRASDPALVLTMRNISGGTLALTSTLGGDYAFTGAGVIGNFGTGPNTVLSASVVMAQGLTSLTFDGAGAAGVNVNSVIASNTNTRAPLVVSADAANAGTGIVTLAGANTFSGSVRLDSGTLAVGNARARRTHECSHDQWPQPAQQRHHEQRQ